MSLVGRYFKLDMDNVQEFIEQASENSHILPFLIHPFKVLTVRESNGQFDDNCAGKIKCSREEDQAGLKRAMDDGLYTYNFIFGDSDITDGLFIEVTEEEFNGVSKPSYTIENLLKSHFEAGGTIDITTKGGVLFGFNSLEAMHNYLRDVVSGRRRKEAREALLAKQAKELEEFDANFEG